MAAALLVLLLAAVLLVACWKRLLGLAVSRFAHGKAFRLTVGQFCFGGLIDVRLRLHRGPVRELRISRIAVSLSSKHGPDSGSEDSSSSSGSLWQALLNGHLLLPVSLQGVSLRLAPAPTKAANAAAPTAAAGPNEAIPPVQGGAGTPEAAAPTDGPNAGRPAGGKKSGRQLRAPLLALAHLPLSVEGLTVVDEERGVQLRLDRLTLTLLSAQQLVLEGLSAGLLLDGGNGGSGGSGSTGSTGGGSAGSSPASPSTLGVAAAPSSPRKGPASPLRRLRGAQEAAPQVQAVFQMDRLLLEHQHDGSFSLQDLQLKVGAAAAASVPGAPAVTASPAPHMGLQRLSLQLGATSLIVSKQLLLWAQHQQAAAAQAAAARRAARPQRAASSSGGSAGKQQLLQRLLPLLPKEVSLEAQSCSVGTDAPGSSASSSDSLPLQAAFGLQGICCRLARAAPAGDSSGSSAADGTPLASVTAGWQRLSISLGAAAEAVEAPGQQLPAALVMSSGTAEWSLALAEGAPVPTASSSDGSSHGQAPLSAAFEVSIGALHTDVCHPAVQPLVAQLRLAAKAAKSASKPAAGGSDVAPPACASDADAGASSQQQEPVAKAAGRAASGTAKRPPLLAQWRASISLGDGSRLLFTDAAGRCCWSSGLASCRLAVQSSSGGSSSSASASGSAPGGPASASAAGVSGSVEVHGIEMHAVATAGGSLAGEPGAAVQQGQPPQMLAAKLLRVEVQHGAAAAAVNKQSGLEPGPQEQHKGHQAGGGTAVDATTAGVHLLVQQQQLATVASVILSLLPPPKAASLPGTPPRTGSDAASADAGVLMAAAAAAAAEAISPHGSAAGRQAERPRRPPPRLTFSCTDTLLLLPTSVAVPAEQAVGGSLLLLPAAPALLLASVAGSFGGSSRPTVAEAEGCCLLYAEGPHSQRFPSSTAALKEQATAVVLSLDVAKFVQPPPAAVAADGSAGDATARQLELGAVAVTADADALLCMAAVADSAAQQLMAALAAAPPRPASPQRRRPKAAKQPQPLAVHVRQLSVAQPMSAVRDMVLEVAAVHAVVGANGGTQHSVRTGRAVLSMLGKPVLRWHQLATTLRLPEGDGRLQAQPLPEPWPAAAAEDGGEGAGIGSDAGPVAEESSGAPAAGSPSWEAYHRARLGAWLQADAATAPGADSQSAAEAAAQEAAAAALGAGPASILDATLSGAELIVPHDGEPGPTQRYSELYFKALETAAQQHLQCLKQFQRQRRSSSAAGKGADAAAAAGDAAGCGVGPAPANEAGGLPPPAQQEQAQQQAPRRKRQLFPMQINLAAEDVALRFEHHPLEAWLASRGPLLQQMATQKHLWGEVAAAVQPADSASPLHAAMVESAFATVQAASQQAWDGLMHDLFQQYRGKLQRLQAAELASRRSTSSSGDEGSGAAGGSGGSRPYSAGRPPPDLMLLSCSRLQGLVVLCAGSAEARAAAAAQIVAVDPPSKGVPMSKMLKLHVDACLADFEMRLAGASQPMVAATRARLSGAAAVARQATLPPQTTERRLPVGAHRSVPIPVTIKGCRTVFKFYTDLRLHADTLSVCHSQGLEPALALVSLSGKRLSPSDPDKTVARPPPIPWWDDLRYMWRGATAAGIRRFQLTLAAHNLPDVDATSERLEGSVEDVTARLLTGQYELTGQALRVTLHRSAGMSQLGGTLLALPFVEAPYVRINVGVACKLPGGRSADEHHLFPNLHGPAPPGALQEPVYAGVVYKADSWDVTLEADLGQPGASAAAAAAADGAAAGPLPALLGPFSGAAAVGYLGGHQVHWMKQYVALMNRLPPQLRQVSRRGSFFWRKPPSGVPKKGFGKMMQQLSLRIVAAPLEIVHFAADPSEAAHGVRLHAPSCSYTASYLLNQPLPSFLKLPPHARASKARRPEPTRTITLGMEVEAGTVTVHKPDAPGPGSDPLGLLDGGGSTMSLGLGPGSAPGTATAASQRASAASSAGAAAAAAAAVAAEGEEVGHRLSLLNPPAGEESSSLLDDLIAPTSARHQRQPTIAAGVVTVTQDALAPPGSSNDPAADPLADALAPQGSRPLRVLISDCRVLVDQTARDAVWGAVEHLIGAFSASGATQRRRLAQAAAHQMLPTSAASSPSPSLLIASPSMPWSAASPAAQLQRHISESQRSTPLTTPAGGASMEFAGAAEAATAAAAAASGGSRVPSPSPAPSGDSSNELLTLLLQQQQAGEGAGADGQQGGGAAGAEGAAGAAGTPAGSPALLHPGPELDDGEEEDAPLSSPADDIHGQLRYTVEVVDLQINAEAGAAQGRLLLAARSGRLRGLRIPDATLNVTALAMEQVSAYVTLTDVDPDAPVVWLQPTPNGYTVPAGQGMLPVRRIFEPVQISLRHSKVSASSGGGGGNGPGRPPRRPSRGGHRRSPSGVGPGGSSRGEELLFKVPELRAKLDSREFEVLTDVISWAQAPGPATETVAAEGELLAELPGEEEAEEARRLYALVLQQLGELRRTTLQLRASLGLQAFASQLAAPGPGGLLLPPLEVTHFLVADTADFVAVQFNTQAELGVAMREHLTAASAAAAAAAGAAGVAPVAAPGTQQQQQQEDGSASGAGLLVTEGGAPSSAAGAPAALVPACSAAVARQRLGERQAEQQQALLLRWVEDQEGGAFEALESAKSQLLALKAVARKRQHKHSASRVLLQVDQLVWQLCTPSRDPFIQASIRRLSLDKFKNKDHSGFAKFGIHRIEILDTQGVLGPGPGVPAGVILSVWNPDASWERDAMLRVVATMGVPTRTHIIYDHLDVIVHPLAFHLTEGLAVAFWEYFFPREDESKARHRRSATALPGSGMADYGSQQGSPMPPASPSRRSALLMAAEGGPVGSQPSSGGQSPLAAGTPRGSGITNTGWRSAPSKLHRRSSSGALAAEAVQQQGALSRQSTFERHGGAAAAAAAAAEASLLAAAAETAAALAAGGMGPGAGSGSGLARLSAGPMARLQRTSSMAGAGGGRLHASRSSASLAPSEDAASRAAHPLHRKVRFVHVKINRAHCRATYEGYPLTFTDLKLVIDNRTYANIEGRWRDLFNKMKWDIVKSVVKSVAGLQGRKFKELLPEGFPGEEGEGGGRRKTGLLAQLTALGKGRKEGLPGVPGEPPLSEEELREQQKRRMLFGQSWPAATPKAAQQAQQAQQGQQQGGASLPASPARGGGPPAGGETADRAPGSAGVSPRGSAHAEAAAPGEIYGSLSAAAAAPGPPASSAFGSRLGSLDLPAPPLHPEDSGGGLGPSSSRGGAADPAAAALLGGGPGGGGGRPGLTTPRWAKSLASGAKKGLAKAKEALRDSLQE